MIVLNEVPAKNQSADQCDRWLQYSRMRSNTGNHLIRHRLSLWGFGVFDIRSRMFSGQLRFIRRRLVSIWTCKTCPLSARFQLAASS